MNTRDKIRWPVPWKPLVVGGIALAVGTLLGLEPAWAKTMGELGSHIASQGQGLGNGLASMLYVGGMAAGGVAAIKLKANRDSPQQTPLSHAVVALAVCALLLFLPQTFKTAGDSVFGNEAAKNAIGGVTTIGN